MKASACSSLTVALSFRSVLSCSLSGFHAGVRTYDLLLEYYGGLERMAFISTRTANERDVRREKDVGYRVIVLRYHEYRFASGLKGSRTVYNVVRSGVQLSMLCACFYSG